MYELSSSQTDIQNLGAEVIPFLENGFKAQVIRFQSPRDFVEQINKAVDMKLWEKEGCAFHGSDDREWRFGSDFLTYERTTQALRNGEAPIRLVEQAKNHYEQILELDKIRTLTNSAKTFKKKRVFAEEGSELSIDRVMSGDSDYWEKTTKGKISQSVIIGCNMSLNANRGEEDFNLLGVMLYCASDILSKAGFSVEIHYLNYTGNLNIICRYSCTDVIIKQANELLDMEKILSCGLPGTQRCYDFAVTVNCGGGHGCEKRLNDKIKSILNFDIYIDGRVPSQEEIPTRVEEIVNEVIKNNQLF